MKAAAATLVTAVVRPQAALSEEPVPEPESIPVSLTLGTPDDQYIISANPNPLVVYAGSQYRLSLYCASKTTTHSLSVVPEFADKFTPVSLQLQVPNAYVPGGLSLVEIKAPSVNSIKR